MRRAFREVSGARQGGGPRPAPGRLPGRASSASSRPPARAATSRKSAGHRGAASSSRSRSPSACPARTRARRSRARRAGTRASPRARPRRPRRPRPRRASSSTPRARPASAPRRLSSMSSSLHVGLDRLALDALARGLGARRRRLGGRAPARGRCSAPWPVGPGASGRALRSGSSLGVLDLRLLERALDGVGGSGGRGASPTSPSSPRSRGTDRASARPRARRLGRPRGRSGARGLLGLRPVGRRPHGGGGSVLRAEASGVTRATCGLARSRDRARVAGELGIARAAGRAERLVLEPLDLVARRRLRRFRSRCSRIASSRIPMALPVASKTTLEPVACR